MWNGYGYLSGARFNFSWHRMSKLRINSSCLKKWVWICKTYRALNWSGCQTNLVFCLVLDLISVDIEWVNEEWTVDEEYI